MMISAAIMVRTGILNLMIVSLIIIIGYQIFRFLMKIFSYPEMEMSHKVWLVDKGILTGNDVILNYWQNLISSHSS